MSSEKTTDEPPGFRKTLTLSNMALSRLIWLCEKEAIRLRKFAADHANDPDEADAAADADMDGSYFAGLADMLRAGLQWSFLGGCLFIEIKEADMLRAAREGGP